MCALGRALHARRPLGRSRQHRGEGADGGGCHPLRPRCLPDPRARPACRRAPELIVRLLLALAAVLAVTVGRGRSRRCDAAGRRDRPGPRSAGQPPDRADRARLRDAEDQGRGRHARRRLRHDGGGAQPRDLPAPADAPRAGRRAGRDDAKPDRRHEHRQRRPRRDREPCRRGPVPADPCRRRPVLVGARDAHAVPGAPARAGRTTSTTAVAQRREPCSASSSPRSASPTAASRSDPT